MDLIESVFGCIGVLVSTMLVFSLVGFTSRKLRTGKVRYKDNQLQQWNGNEWVSMDSQYRNVPLDNIEYKIKVL